MYFSLSLLFLPVVALILWTAVRSHLYREKWEMLSQIAHNLRVSNSIILEGSGEQCSLWQNSWSIVDDVREMWVSVWVRLFGSCEEMKCWNMLKCVCALNNVEELHHFRNTNIQWPPKKIFWQLRLDLIICNFLKKKSVNFINLVPRWFVWIYEVGSPQIYTACANACPTSHLLYKCMLFIF